MTQLRSVWTASLFGLGIMSMTVVSPGTSIAAQQTAGRALSTSETITGKATITAIDKATRMVTLRNAKGIDMVVYAGEEVKRFNELKVGDVVSATYSESVAVSVRKPGAAAPPKESESVVPRQGAPGGTVTREQTLSVTVQEIDLTAPSLTVKGPEGRTMSFKVRDKSYLQNLKVGDKVDITVTQALLLQADSAPK